ncbi:hypothetical protein L1987_66957 [Smallanthus sonchifolius]|uniref:Uncharacterized protein n=1 Tax=Smallanthus sonchifolius TaxID=185202 RepID=A0ACB9BYV5_9ASTR|nr:hypothetical protein L1987_66957 [Smallanthus sonchifolius]
MKENNGYGRSLKIKRNYVLQSPPHKLNTVGTLPPNLYPPFICLHCLKIQKLLLYRKIEEKEKWKIVSTSAPVAGI